MIARVIAKQFADRVPATSFKPVKSMTYRAFLVSEIWVPNMPVEAWWKHQAANCGAETAAMPRSNVLKCVVKISHIDGAICWLHVS